MDYPAQRRQRLASQLAAEELAAFLISNPVNVTYLTGLGLRRQREIVHQYAQNDRRTLPPSGIPLGNIQAGFAYLGNYRYDLGNSTYPSDGAASAPYPFYDRWGDAYNTMTEFIAVNQARSLASLAFWAAQTPAASQRWRSAEATIALPGGYAPVNAPVSVSLQCPGLDLSAARVVWEASGQQPSWIPASTDFRRDPHPPAVLPRGAADAVQCTPVSARIALLKCCETQANVGGTVWRA